MELQELEVGKRYRFTTNSGTQFDGTVLDPGDVEPRSSTPVTVDGVATPVSDAEIAEVIAINEHGTPLRHETCVACGQRFEVDPDDQTTMYYEESLFAEGNTALCEVCSAGPGDTSTLICRFTAEQTEVIRLDAHTAMRVEPWPERYRRTGNDLPEWVRKHFAPQTCVDIGGGRGYRELPARDLVKVATGWITGWPDSTTQHKVAAGDAFEKLRNNPPEFPIYWEFSPTSNVFSTASTVWVENDGDLGAFEHWLRTACGLTLDTFIRAFD